MTDGTFENSRPNGVALGGRPNESANPEIPDAQVPVSQTAVPLSYSDPSVSAERYLAERHSTNGVLRLRAYFCKFHVWLHGVYREQSADETKAELWNWLRTQTVKYRSSIVNYEPTSQKVSGILEALKALTHIPDETVPPVWLKAEESDPPAKEIVACENGLLHFPTRRLLPHTPRLFNTSKLGTEFRPDAGQPIEWLRFLDSVWESDAEAIETLQEWFGYLLTPDTSQQKILLIVGPPRSGKGTIAKLLTELLGPKSVASPTLQSFGDQFGLQSLSYCSLAIISDARLDGRGSVATVERLLSISGEDRITIDRKYLAAMTVRFPTRIMILTNEVPRLPDASGALANRFIALRMTESFLGREDLKLIDRLLPELPGVLNWALDGYDRLAKRGQFRQPRSACDISASLKELGSAVHRFVAAQCERSPSAEVEIDELYRAYKTYCEAEGSPPSDKAQFGRDLGAVVPELRRSQHQRPDGSRPRYYRGVRLQGVHADLPILRKNDQEEEKKG